MNIFRCITIAAVIALAACSSASDSKLLETAKADYGLSESDYDYSASVKSIDDPSYSHIGWVEIKNIRSGLSQKIQYGYSKKNGEWEKSWKQQSADIDQSIKEYGASKAAIADAEAKIREAEEMQATLKKIDELKRQQQ